MATVDSVKIFKTHWILWEIMGLHRQRFPFKTLFIIYSLLLNGVVSFGYPAHLIIGLFTSDNPGDYAKTLAIAATCIASFLKILVFTYKLPNLRKLESLLATLDKRITPSNKEEQECFETTRRSALFILNAFVVPIGTVVTFYLLSTFFRKECALIQPGWLPWDWRKSLAACRWATFYQCLGLFAGLQLTANDSYAPMVLCVLAGHTRLLGIRLARLGYDHADREENDRRLLECIKDQKDMYRLYDIARDIISSTMMVQFLTTTFNVCMDVYGLLFYADTPIEALFYIAYFFCLLVEISSICYYGSYFELVQSELHYSAFSSNWMDQSEKYKKHMLLFMVRAMKRAVTYAGNTVPVNLMTYFSIIKGTYSLFMVVQKVNERDNLLKEKA